MSDLQRDALLLTELVSEIAVAVDTQDVGDDLGTALTLWSVLVDARKALGDAVDDLAAILAEDMPEKRMTVMGVGTFEKHRKADRKGWDKDDLLRAVLDTKRVTSDGEIIEETPLDKVLHVWNLPAPRTTALRERGLDADEFCSVQYGKLTLQVVTS